MGQGDREACFPWKEAPPPAPSAPPIGVKKDPLLPCASYTQHLASICSDCLSPFTPYVSHRRKPQMPSSPHILLLCPPPATRTHRHCQQMCLFFPQLSPPALTWIPSEDTSPFAALSGGSKMCPPGLLTRSPGCGTDIPFDPRYYFHTILLPSSLKSQL